MKHHIKNSLFIIFLLSISVAVFSKEENLSLMKLKQCPNSPNCVSSQSDSKMHQIAPLSYKGAGNEAMQRIKTIILALPRTKLIDVNDQYLHIEFKSFIFRFVDDVEVLIDDDEKLIHFRSASRMGYSDMGTNRRRIEQIQREFMQ